MVSLLSTKFHDILFSSFRGVALTNCDRQTDEQTDRTKTICLPTKVGGDIISWQYICIINHVSAEALTTGSMIPSWTNSPPAEVSTQ